MVGSMAGTEVYGTGVMGCTFGLHNKSGKCADDAEKPQEEKCVSERICWPGAVEVLASCFADEGFFSPNPGQNRVEERHSYEHGVVSSC